MARQRRAGWGRGPELHDVLAYASRPLEPLLGRMRIRREGERKFDSGDILLPEGYVAELVASGFKTPVHCTFDDQGACYVFECGYKITGPPRILEVDLSTGQWEIFFEFPQEQWFQTGAVTGGCWNDGYLYFGNTDRLSRLDELCHGSMPCSRRASGWGGRVGG